MSNAQDPDRELDDARTLLRLSGLRTGERSSAFIEPLLDAAMSVMRADFASLQRLDVRRGELHLLGSKNFHPDAISFWQTVSSETGTTSGSALQDAKRVLVPDVRVPALQSSPDQPYWALNGIVAVQSTPLTARDGRVLGMLSTHWRHAHEPRERELAFFDLLARQAADWMERQETEARLKAAEARHDFANRLIDELRGLSDPDAIMSAAGRVLSAELDAARTVYVSIVDGKPTRASEFARRSPLASAMPARPVGLGPTLLATLQRGEDVVVDDVATDPKIEPSGRARLLEAGVGAAMAASLLKDGVWVGVLVVHHESPRVWSELDRLILRETAERTWAALQQAQAMRAREELERLHTALFDESPIATSLSRLDDLSRVTANRAFVRLFRLEGLDLKVTTTQLGLVDPTVATEVREKLDADGVVREFEFAARTRAGDSIRVLGDWAVVTIGGERYALGTLRDVTEQRRNEEKTREHEQTLDALLETAAQGIMSIDEQGEIRTANRALHAMFGWPAGALVGQASSVLLPTDPGTGSRAEPNTPRELVGRRRDGTTFPVEVSMCVVARPSADVTFAFVSDVTERHESFRRLRERTAELDQLTSRLRRVSAELTLAEQAAREQLAKSLHDGLQQLLFAATLSLDRASKRVAAKDERATESLTKARGELEEAISTSRTLSVELFPRALHEGGLIAAIEWLASWMREKYGLTVELTGDPEAQIRGRDVRTLVFESVRELLFNAVKHASVESIKIEVTAPDDATVRVLVADRGAGFDPSVLGKSTDQQRLGLGLFTIRERLKLVGGRLDVESAPGSGSTFLLVAPNEEAGVG